MCENIQELWAQEDQALLDSMYEGDSLQAWIATYEISNKPSRES